MNAELRLDKIEVVANAAAGSVGPGAQEALSAILADSGHTANIAAVQPSGLEAALKAAVAAKPDLLIVLAGDGTARTAATMAGSGLLLAPLAGGTLNMLPHALYGQRDWKTALTETLANPTIAEVAGGEVEGHPFFVAAILGSPALWAPAREAVREGRPMLAIERARIAWMRAFSSRLRYSIEGGEEIKAEALAVMCPLVSPVMDSAERALEVSALDPAGVGDALRLGLLASLGRWRDDQKVTVTKARTVSARAHQRIPAVLDGEPVMLRRSAVVKFKPGAFRALVPAS